MRPCPRPYSKLKKYTHYLFNGSMRPVASGMLMYLQLAPIGS